MTTPARQAEAEAASIAFHLALTKLGAQAVADSLRLWEEVPPTTQAATAGAWLAKAVDLVSARRVAARALALAYYRLVRALHTDFTVAAPGQPESGTVDLDDLREDFARWTSTQSPAAPTEPTPTSDPDAAPEAADGLPGGGDAIPVEAAPTTRAQERADELAAREEARTLLARLGAINQQRLVDAIDKAQAAEVVDMLRIEAHDRAGARQAATTSRLIQNGARSALWSAGEGDRRAIGYVRLSRTGTPCGWCAMLISRGAVYRSEKGATLKGGAAKYEDGDLYHDNCNCYAMPVFTREQFNSSALYELNRLYAEQWPRVTKGLSGKAAVSAWRRFIRQEQKTARDQASQATTSL